MLRDYVPGRETRPVPPVGSAERGRLAALQSQPWFVLRGREFQPGWNRRTGDTGRAPGWILTTTLN